MEPSIERAREQDADEVFRLLEADHLPVEGLRDHLATALVARPDGRIAGSAALQVGAPRISDRHGKWLSRPAGGE